MVELNDSTCVLFNDSFGIVLCGGFFNGDGIFLNAFPGRDLELSAGLMIVR